MLLTKEDIARIVTKGFKKQEFCFSSRETDGFWQLKNVNGHCFFLKEGKCSIYEFRPMGCRTYPLVFDITDNDVIIDDECREPEWFANQQYDEEQLQTVKNIANTLLKEKNAIK